MCPVVFKPRLVELVVCVGTALLSFGSANAAAFLPPAQSQQDSDKELIPNTQELAIPFTPPDVALQSWQLPKGFRATLFASEPDIHQPIAMTFDERGRLWVVENYTYSDRKENFNDELSDRVVIFSDDDNDGKFDSRKIFWDKGKKLTGIELGRGGVWLTAAPEFIFIPDADRDDVPDGPAEVILDGFDDDAIRHNLVNGLRWGPDGWLYSRHGIQAVSYVGKPGQTVSQRTAMSCCIWRYHPDRDVFEIVAEGGTNSWGFDFDQHGEMFFINTVIGHLFHVVPGARYNRMYGSHFNPYTWQTIDQTADHVHWGSGEQWFDAKKGVVGDAGTGSDATDQAGGGHAHSGMMIYQGDNWPREFRDRLFTLNFHGRRMNQERLVREGNSYVGKHESDLFQTTDPWFRGVELTSGPDGAVYVLDWSDIGECHENDGIHRTSGRIFKFAFGKTDQPQFADLSTLSDEQLVELLSHENAWYPRMAQRILADRVASGQAVSSEAKLLLVPIVQNWSQKESSSRRIRALQVLNESGECTAKFLLDLLSKSDDEHLRVWCVRLLTDCGPVESSVAAKLVELASDDSSLVRLYVASGLDNLDQESAFKAVEKLAANEVDMQDRVQPKLLWYRIEPFIVGDFDRAMKLFAVSKSQMLRQNIVRRLACDPEQQAMNLQQLTEWASQKTNSHRDDVIAGISQALEGRRQLDAPQAWTAFSTEAKKDTTFDTDTLAKIEEIGAIFGDGLSVDRLRSLAANKAADPAARQQAIFSLSQTANSQQLYPLLKSLIDDRLVNDSVVSALAVCSDPAAASLILNHYARLSLKGKRNAIDTLSTRKPWASELLDGVAKGKIPLESITAWHARQINLFDDAALSDKLSNVWGQVRETDAEKLAEIERLRQSLNVERLGAADLVQGKKLFVANCATCHALFGEGGNTGPDITGADRKNLSYLLENIVDPSASVATTFRASVVALEDGRMLTGVVLDRTEQTLKLQLQEELVTIETDSIEAIRQTKLSLMPERLLDKLTDAEKVDLFGYLMSNGIR